MSRFGRIPWSLSGAAIAFCLAGVLLAGSACATDELPITVAAQLVAETGPASWYGDMYAFHGVFEMAGGIVDSGTAYFHCGGGLALFGEGGMIAFAFQADGGYGLYLMPSGTWTITNATGAYEGLQGSGTYAAEWPFIVPTWEAGLRGLELEMSGVVHYVAAEPPPDGGDGGTDGGDDEPTKPGKGKGKKK